jgi:hypothetical protein
VSDTGAVEVGECCGWLFRVEIGDRGCVRYGVAMGIARDKTENPLRKGRCCNETKEES